MTTSTSTPGMPDFSASRTDLADSGSGLGLGSGGGLGMAEAGASSGGLFADEKHSVPNILSPSGAEYDAPSWMSTERMAATVVGTGAAGYASRGRIPGVGGNAANVAEFRNLASSVTSQMSARTPISNAFTPFSRTSAPDREFVRGIASGQFASANPQLIVNEVLDGSIGRGQTATVVSDLLHTTMSDVGKGMGGNVANSVNPLMNNTPSPSAFKSDIFTAGADGVERTLAEAMDKLPASQRAVVVEALEAAPNGAMSSAYNSLKQGFGEGLESALKNAPVGVRPTPGEIKSAVSGALAAFPKQPSDKAMSQIVRNAAGASGSPGRIRSALTPAPDSKIRSLGSSAIQRVSNSAPGRVASAVGSKPASALKGQITRTNGIWRRAAATNPVARAGLREAAERGARIGTVQAFRMGAMSIPVAGWAVGAAITAAFWIFDPAERGMWKTLVENIKSGWWGGANTPDMNAAPWYPRTQWLPLCGDGNRDPQIEAADYPMAVTMQKAFGVTDSNIEGGLWTLDGFPKLRMGGADIGRAVDDFDITSRKLTQEIDDLVYSMKRIRDSSQGEPLIEMVFKSGLDAAMTNLDAAGQSIVPSLTALQTTAAVEMSNLWGKVSEQNASAREAIAASNQGLSWNPLTGFGLFAANTVGDLGDVSTNLRGAEQALSEALRGTRSLTDGFDLGLQTAQKAPGEKVAVPAPEPAPAPVVPPAGAVPMPGRPIGVTPSPSPSPTPNTGNTGTKKKDNNLAATIADILKSPETQKVGNQAADMANQLANMARNPAAGMGGGMNPMGMGGMGGYNPMGMGMGGYNPAMNPLAQQNPLGQQAVKPEEAKPKAPEVKAPEVKAPEVKPPVKAPTLGAVADGGPKAGGEEKAPPVKPGVGPTPKPEVPGEKTEDVKADGKTEDGKAEGGEHKVKVGEHEVSLPTRQHSDMLKNLMSSDGNQHPSVREAGERAGITMGGENEDIGQRVPSPAKLQPGDVVIGDKQQGVYTGDGRVYTSDGKEIPLSEISMSGAHQGLFHLAVADEPSPGGGGGGGDTPPPPAGGSGGGSGGGGVQQAGGREDKPATSGMRPPSGL